MRVQTVGGFARRRREALGFTRERFAVAADVSVSTVVRLENHDHLPRVSALIRIADGLQCSLDALVEPGRDARIEAAQ